MAAGTQTPSEATPDSESDEAPKISICESCPGKSVFLEAGNTDGWISSNLTVDVVR